MTNDFSNYKMKVSIKVLKDLKPFTRTIKQILSVIALKAQTDNVRRRFCKALLFFILEEFSNDQNTYYFFYRLV